MSWEQIIEAIKIFWQQPVPIIGFSVGMCFIFVLRVISKTSFGKKNLKKLQDATNTLKENYGKLEIETKSKVAELENYYKEALALIEQKKDDSEALILAIGENIHNVKIKALIDEYKAKMTTNIVIEDIVNAKVGEVKTQLELAKEEYEKAKTLLTDELNKTIVEYEEAKNKFMEVIDNGKVSEVTKEEI